MNEQAPHWPHAKGFTGRVLIQVILVRLSEEVPAGREAGVERKRRIRGQLKKGAAVGETTMSVPVLLAFMR